MNTIAIVCGSPGAGKSTFGKKLARKLDAAFIDIDTATEKLVKLALILSGHHPDDRDSPYFKEHFRQPIYEQMFDVAKENLDHTNVVLSGPFTKELRDPEWPTFLEKKLNAYIEIYYVACKLEIRKKRMIQRANPRDKAKLEAWEQANDYYGDESAPVFKHTFVNNSKDLGESL